MFSTLLIGALGPIMHTYSLKWYKFQNIWNVWVLHDMGRQYVKTFGGEQIMW